MTPPISPPADSPAGGAPAASAALPASDAAAMQRQIDDLKEEAAEARRTAEYWAGRAASPAPAAPAAEPDDDTDVLEAITTGGAKGFDALAAKRGFIKRDEVETLINQRATSLTKEQALIEEYPDLRKKDSEFFKATALNYGSLVKSGVPQAVAMETAARQTELEFLRSGKIKLPGAAAEETKAEKEAARRARIAAQAPESGRRQAAAPDGEDDELTPQQMRIADAMGVSHEAYAKRAKAGVSIKGQG